MKQFVLVSLLLASSFCVAKAAPCVYDMTPLPVTQGIVSGITPKGVKLRDGTTVILPDEFLASVRLNQKLAVRGLVSTATHTVQALALDGMPPVCPSVPAIPRGPFAGSPAYDAIRP
ncbi:hypothetical protein [Gluconobacter kanchanaburiensis]|uniref:Uncharacterized protein n=1 Tax=Gluconobacter kanchanaburiensis NBRC 103587 TaxID=1307948 RepID=A0A511B9J3_9PROT|nr:hypothetical protein [Gluconobacter kanchanaburiensis]MBF0862816.1 hypothetical protein [Gluconobacter kanchanaburiensis]GBR70416.1 hypothetical protein AA103587_1860 [Gluconobacter kanchanaburiensis NBRC 103587]GEK97099.1 hypothetical protein GKA01_22960 [Gluconobacter kanchanaburiensis NBRC 103587]